MKSIQVAAVAAALALCAGGFAAAQDGISDMAFLQAARCKGLALGLGADPSALALIVRKESRSRADMLIFKANGETSKAQREARDPARRDKAKAEFADACSTFTGASQTAAGGPASQQTIR